MQLSEVKSHISKGASTLNIKKWDFGASISNDYSVQVDKGEAKQLKASQKQIMTIRVWNSKNLVGITTTSDLSSEGLLKALNQAKVASDYGNDNEHTNFSPLSKEPIETNKSQQNVPSGIKKLLKTLRRAEEKLLNTNRAIKSIPYNGLSETFFRRIYVNSEGASRSYENSQAVLYLYARAEENNKKPRSSGSVKLGYKLDDIDIEACILEASKKTISHLNYSNIKTGKYKICFSPESFLTLVNAFSSMFNARSILDGVSICNKNSLGQEIFSPCINIYDDGLHKENISSAPFDGEGTPTKKLCIIHKGKLKNLLHSESTARIFKTNPTGHAGLGSKVSVSPDWLVIEKSEHQSSLDSSLVHETYKGEFIYIEELNAIHAGVKSSQGSFSLPFDGWKYDNGKKVSIDSATVAGDFRKVIKDIINIEDLQVTTTTGISPHIWIKELSITSDT
tara:strand:- start:5977 stop:7329 length:1353 start_codon:yes stop_codon:yes gene_type:complete